MAYISKRDMTRLAEGTDSPLSAAIVRRDRQIPTLAAEAIRNREAALAFQPVMQATAPHGTAFHEGLIRIHDAAGRIIPARDFIHEIERQELARDLDVLTLDLGLRALARAPSIRLSINMSARSIGYAPWLDTLDRHLRFDSTLGERLMLEINEGSAIDLPDLVRDFMDRLQPKGVAFALDDYGAGRTALRHLRDFLFDAVKIDGQFVRGIDSDPDKVTLVRALIAVAQEFEMLIVATSVERVEEAELLQRLGVDCLQGYLFGAPSVTPPWLEAAQDTRRA